LETEASCVVVDWHVREREDSVAVGFWRLAEQVFVFSYITHVRNENNGWVHGKIPSKGN
jgi:hypothetical protein